MFKKEDDDIVKATRDKLQTRLNEIDKLLLAVPKLQAERKRIADVLKAYGRVDK